MAAALHLIKRRHDARTWFAMRQHQSRQEGYARARQHPGYWPDDEIDERDDDSDDYACTHCGGEGFAQVDDPLWDDCDEFGEGPCKSCRGTGQRRHQWVF